MLTGQYTHSIDAKGRVNFPAKLREELGERFIITRGLDNCLFVYSVDEWDQLAAKLRELPISKSAPLNRFFFAGAAEAEPDKQGRVLLPAHLREYAGLDRDVHDRGRLQPRRDLGQRALGEAERAAYGQSIATAMDELGF